MNDDTSASLTGGLQGPTQRIAPLDVIRGAAMVLMAIDHVRVFAGIPAGGASPAIFFTRWITHFCAPAFIFLAGTSAYLYGLRHQDLSRFLLTRGLWLVVLEFTYMRFAWTFNFDYAHYVMAGVIWAIGCCMILMSALSRLSIAAVGAVGIVIVAGHNLLDPYMGEFISSLPERPFAWLWKFLYVAFFADPIRFGKEGPELVILYSIVPWIGVMACGYAFGGGLIRKAPSRNRLCFSIGLAATALFLVLRAGNLYGDPRPWSSAPSGTGGAPALPAWLSFLNTSKYPASLQFLLMTLGPTIALIPLLDRWSGPFIRAIGVFGRVPFFYYLLHVPVIHALAIVVSLVREGRINAWLFTNQPMGNPPPPEGYTWSLGLLYFIWAITIALLYIPCRWYAALKARRSDWWLSYL